MRYISIEDAAIWISKMIELKSVRFDQLPQWINDRTDYGRRTTPSLSIDIENEITSNGAQWSYKIESRYTENIPELKKFIKERYKINLPSDLQESNRFALSCFMLIAQDWPTRCSDEKSGQILNQIKSDFLEQLHEGDVHFSWLLKFMLEDIEKAQQGEGITISTLETLQQTHSILREGLADFLPETMAYPHQGREKDYDELFISLTGLARKFARVSGDEINPRATLRKCAKNSIRAAIEAPDELDDRYMINDRPIRRHGYSGSGDRCVTRLYLRNLFGYDGMLFLRGESITALLKHGEITEWEFSADGSQVSDDFFHAITTASCYDIIANDFPDDPIEREGNDTPTKLVITLDDIWILRDDVIKEFGAELLTLASTTSHQPQSVVNIDMRQIRFNQDNRLVNTTQNHNHFTQNNSYTAIHQPPSDIPQEDPNGETASEAREWGSGVYINFFEDFVIENQSKTLQWSKNKALIEDMLSPLKNLLPQGYLHSGDGIVKIDKNPADPAGGLVILATLSKEQLMKNWSKWKFDLIKKYGLTT